VSSRQLALLGMESPVLPKPKKTGIQEQIVQLQDRVLQLELEVTLLRLQLERGDTDHA